MVEKLEIIYYSVICFQIREKVVFCGSAYHSQRKGTRSVVWQHHLCCMSQ